MAVWNPEAVELVFNLQSGPNPIVNTVVVDWGGIPTAPVQMDTLAQEAYGIYAASFLPLLSLGVELQSVDAYSLQSATAPVGHYVPSDPTEGEATGELLALQNAAVVTWRTAARGRSGRGRMYLSGFTEAQANGQALSTGVAASVQTAATAFIAAFVANETPICVYSRETNKLPRAVGLLLPITAAEVRTPVFGAQRRRNRREATA